MVEVGGRGGASGGREASPPSFERNSNIIQHALLPLDEVRRIYVAFGEHPAASGLYVFCGTLGSYPMHVDHIGWPRGVFLALRVTMKFRCGTCADIFGIWSTC